MRPRRLRQRLRRYRRPGPAPKPDDEEIGAFKAELEQALADPSQLPGDELSHAVEYGDSSDEAFLRRLWHDLYGELPDTEASHNRVLGSAYYEGLAGRLYGLLIGLDDRLDRDAVRQLYHFIEVGEYGLALEEIAGALANAKVPITNQERGEMLALTSTMKLDNLVPRAWDSARVPGSHIPGGRYLIQRSARPVTSAPRTSSSVMAGMYAPGDSLQEPGRQVIHVRRRESWGSSNGLQGLACGVLACGSSRCRIHLVKRLWELSWSS